MSHHRRLLRASRRRRAERRGPPVIHPRRDDRVRCIVIDLAAPVLEGRGRAATAG